MKHIITPENHLLRKIPKKPSHLNNGRVTSACFKPDRERDNDGLSVNVKELVPDLNSIYDPTSHVLGEVSASLPLQLGFECEHDPIEDNHSHALIKGIDKSGAKKLSLACIII